MLDLPVLGLTRITVGDRGLREIALAQRGTASRTQPDHPLLQRAIGVLRAWAEGTPVPASLPLDLSGLTDFQRQVLLACRRIPFGEVRSYGQLAEQVGKPGAARAIGGCMARNPLPVVIPCHRVVAANGIGGFSPGPEFKQRMWVVEGITLDPRRPARLERRDRFVV